MDKHFTSKHRAENISELLDNFCPKCEDEIELSADGTCPICGYNVEAYRPDPDGAE